MSVKIFLYTIKFYKHGVITNHYLYSTDYDK